MNRKSTIYLYFRKPPEGDRWLPGDRYIRPALRRLLRGKRVGGVEKVFLNLCRGFDKIGIKYEVNVPFRKVPPAAPVVVLGEGANSLKGYDISNRIIAGIGLMTHPSEWPRLCIEYPIAIYLQHSEWAANVYVPYFGEDVCKLWPAGIDTELWRPEPAKKNGILIYNKIRWDKDHYNAVLAQPIRAFLEQSKIPYTEIVYGSYNESDYKSALKRSKAMIFLAEHESQGFACCEAMAMNVPVFAWDQGFCLDPNRFKWNDPVIPATSVPFFDSRCGDRFTNLADFDIKIERFLANVEGNVYHPREYIMENITLEKSAQRMLDLIEMI